MKTYIPSIYLAIGIIDGYLMAYNIFLGFLVAVVLISITAILLNWRKR